MSDNVLDLAVTVSISSYQIHELLRYLLDMVYVYAAISVVNYGSRTPPASCLIFKLMSMGVYSAKKSKSFPNSNFKIKKFPH